MSAHIDTFARDRLPPPEALPELLFDLPGLQFPARLNATAELLDRRVAAGEGGRLCIQGETVRWTYAELQSQVNRIARVLVHDLGLVPGNRVLLRGANSPMLAACFLAIFKAGGIAVGTMPLLRARELRTIIDKAQISHALCDARLQDELDLAAPDCPTLTRRLNFIDGALESAAARHPDHFEAVPTAADDIALMAFTSGTTGVPKGTMHFHRDILAACACWPPHVLRPTADDVFIGSPPLAFTFGLGGLLLFPLSVGASTVLIEKASPEALLPAIETYRATVCFTAPTSYRAMAGQLNALAASGHRPDLSSLRKCVSAGEALPAATRALWQDTTGLRIIDGIGSTEMLHIFISADEDEARPGATGKPVPGYVAAVLDEQGQPLPPGHVGRLAVKGPTGCKYLADDRQAAYVQNGWNITGDAYLVDVEGHYVYQARTDDMIISGGYNIAGPEVEGALLLHPAVAECGVVGQPDAERGEIVKACVVLKPGHRGDAAMVKALQDFVKQTVAPYKYPRAIEFREALPRTETGKLQRFRLRQEARGVADATSASAMPAAAAAAIGSSVLAPVPSAPGAPATASSPSPHQVLQPSGWAAPRGYANGVAARGAWVVLAGQIGWNAQCQFESDDLVAQVRQALLNVRALLAEAGCGPEHMVRMTWYLVDKREYLARAREIGGAYREVLGREYGVAMTAVQVAGLIEDRAKVEIEVTAVRPT